jgi:hypothetical protein
MGLHLGVVKPTGSHQWSFDLGREILEEQYRQIQEDQEKLTNFVNGDLCPYVQLSRQNYVELFNRLVFEAGNTAQFMPNRGTFGMALSHCVLTFAATLCMHKEQTDTKIHRIRRARWGEEFAKSKKPLGSIYYDHYFGYRFFARLRNFLLHESADLIKSEVSKTLDRPEPELKVFAYRDDLVGTRERRKHWSSMVSEIDQLGEKIDLTPLIDEATEATVLLASQARLLLHPGISQCVRRMQALRGEVGDFGANDTPTIISMPDDGAGDVIKPELAGLGFDIAEKVADLIRSSRRSL